MALTMPRVRQCPTANYSPVSIAHELFIWHMMEGSYQGSVAWLCDPRARASAHLCMPANGSELTQLAPLSMKAWAECNFNGRGCSLEIEGFTKNGLSDVTLNAAALIGAWHCLAYAIPPVWAQGGRGRGVCCHHDLGAGGGGHVDICGVGDATWLRMMAAVQNAYGQLKALPSLPEFALHGLPGPHQVEAPPDVAPEPSHGGSARAESGDAHAHPTPSRFPLHSIPALQSDLNALGAAPALVVDGRYGVATSAALRRLQAQRGLTADGLIGPQSWAAIDAAMKDAA